MFVFQLTPLMICLMNWRNWRLRLTAHDSECLKDEITVFVEITNTKNTTTFSINNEAVYQFIYLGSITAVNDTEADISNDL